MIVPLCTPSTIRGTRPLLSSHLLLLNINQTIINIPNNYPNKSFFIYLFNIPYRYEIIPIRLPILPRFVLYLSSASSYRAQPIDSRRTNTAPTTSTLSHLPLFVSRSARHSNHHLAVCGSYSTICAFLYLTLIKPPTLGRAPSTVIRPTCDFLRFDTTALLLTLPIPSSTYLRTCPSIHCSSPDWIFLKREQREFLG